MNAGPVCIGTRGSALARWQAEHVRQLLVAAHPDIDVQIRIITTQGDRVLDVPLPQIGGKGLFTLEIESALRDRAIDVAVHSLKDLPTEEPQGLVIAATPPRADVRDVLVSRHAGATLRSLPPGATIGTSSSRRAAQARHLRPDLRTIDIRGNVDTRLRKARDPDGPYDAILLAAAGLQRLGLLDAAAEMIAPDDVLPAPGQGALAVQCRADDVAAKALLAPLNDAATSFAASAERAFLAGLGGGCAVPVAALAEVCDGTLRIRGRVNSTDGGEQVDVSLESPAGDRSAAEAAGERLAGMALARGAGPLLSTGRRT